MGVLCNFSLSFIANANLCLELEVGTWCDLASLVQLNFGRTVCMVSYMSW